MAHFLRDQHITNVTITEDALKQINELFESRIDSFNAVIPKDDNMDKKAFLSYIIRYDQKGYRIYSCKDLLKYFHQAKEVERILFRFETGDSIRLGRDFGAVMELTFDKNNTNNCNLVVTSDDKDWVDVSFSAVQDILVKFKNRSGLARTLWTKWVVQIIGISAGFLISLCVAAKISPKLAIENSFVICFFFILLIFSNIWSSLNFIDKYFPSLKFYRPDIDRVDFWKQAIVNVVIGIVLLAIINFFGSYAISAVSSLIAKSP